MKLRAAILLVGTALPSLPGRAQSTLSPRLVCEAHFFEAYFTMPLDDKIKQEYWLMPESMHQSFKKPPLASYAFFRRLESQTWNLEILKPLRLQFPFLPRFEITFLEARLTSLGQAFYRFEYKVNHLQSVTFTLDALQSAALFLRHAKTHDEFLHLTCRPN
jgi:hypothetical protein